MLNKSTNLYYSLGFRLKDEGAVIVDVVPGSPADGAGIAPETNLIAVNGRKYSKEVLQDALKGSGADSRIIQLLIQKDEIFTTVDVRYAGKSRYPRLEREASTPDLLTAISTGRAP